MTHQPRIAALLPAGDGDGTPWRANPMMLLTTGGVTLIQ